MVEKRKNGLNSFEVVSNLGVEVGHLKPARTNTVVRDAADYKWNELPIKRPNLGSISNQLLPHLICKPQFFVHLAHNYRYDV